MRLEQLLDATTRARVPALVWGSPGVGKTAAIRTGPRTGTSTAGR
jgi:hypothetical protein